MNTNPQLRNLPGEWVGDDLFLLIDPETKRRFFFDQAKGRVIVALDGKHSTSEIASDCLGDPTSEPEVDKFIGKLTSLGLIETGQPVAELRQRQVETLRRESERKRDTSLLQTLKWSSTAIPFHRRLREFVDDIHNTADLAKLPFMTKRDIRENFPHNLLPEGLDIYDLVDRKQVTLESTSGTSGERLQVLFDRKFPHFPPTYPAMWPVKSGLKDLKIALFTTPICSGTICHMGGMPYEDRVDNFYLTLNSSDRVMSLRQAELEDVVSDLERFKPSVLLVDPVYCTALLRQLQRAKLPIPKVDVIWTAYEYCSVLYKEILEEGFGVPVFDNFGSTDTGGGVAAFQCERGRHHVREDKFLFEFVRDGRPVELGELGDIVVTSLNHRYMPIVRYRVGDLARPIGYACDCSHGQWPAFDLEGRLKDCMFDTKGGIVTTRAFDSIFRGLRWLDFYRFTQQSRTEYELLGVRRDGTDESDADEFMTRAKALLGDDASIRVRYSSTLPAEKSLKYRLTSSALWTNEDQL